MYKYEMHAHCSEVSKCGRSTAVEMARALKQNGYAGVVFTDHFIHGNTNIPRQASWTEKMDFFFDSYKDVLKYGEQHDFDVLIGFEHYYAGGKEELCYGDITKEKLLKHPEMQQLDIYGFCSLCHKLGFKIIQAHPFRERDYIDAEMQPIPEIIDGVEVINCCNRPEENQRAMSFADKIGGIRTIGSDTHSENFISGSGMLFNKRMKTCAELAENLINAKIYYAELR